MKTKRRTKNSLKYCFKIDKRVTTFTKRKKRNLDKPMIHNNKWVKTADMCKATSTHVRAMNNCLTVTQSQ